MGVGKSSFSAKNYVFFVYSNGIVLEKAREKIDRDFVKGFLELLKGNVSVWNGE